VFAVVTEMVAVGVDLGAAEKSSPGSSLVKIADADCDGDPPCPSIYRASDTADCASFLGGIGAGGP